MSRPRVTIVGLGPAGPGLITNETRDAIDNHAVRFLRTARHPSASAVASATTFDDVYDTATSLDSVYQQIVERLVAAAHEHGRVLYAVPGSPLVAERTVELLRHDPRTDTTIVPALSFLDLAWAALGIDPLAAGVRLVDGQRFAIEAAAERGPLLVAQCDDPIVLSAIKLAIDDTGPTVTVLQRLGLPDQAVFSTPWSEIDRAVTPDHLTTLFIPLLSAPVGYELVRFYELVKVLREQCPWDQKQTHRSLTRHLLEESYELLEAIEAVDALDIATYAHLEEELGDVLFQVFFHAVLGAEEGAFTLADVATGIHDKLVRRHPHVFGSVRADDADTVVANWEQIKKSEKGHDSLMDGIAGNLPSLVYATKVQRKAASVGFDWPDVSGALPKISEEARELSDALRTGDEEQITDELGDILFAITNVARHAGVDAEAALRGATGKFRRRFMSLEALVTERGLDIKALDLVALDALWDEVKARSGHE